MIAASIGPPVRFSSAVNMKYDEFKGALGASPELAKLDEATSVALFHRCYEETLFEGAVIYSEGAALDYTFGMVLSGDLIVEKTGSILGGIIEHQIFGEMAYFTNERVRTATLRVGSPRAVGLKFKVTQEELSTPVFCALKNALGLQTWSRFVNTSQSGSEYPAATSEWA